VIAIPHTVRVFLATDPQDFRKSIDGLAAVVQSHLIRDPMTGDVYVFHNRRRNALKLLYWDHGGFCLVYKRLE
jgi:transposase